MARSVADRMPLAALSRPRVRDLRALTRWYEWYDSKIPLVFVGMYYAALRSGDSPATALLLDMAWLLALVCVYAAFGYVVNDFSDRAVDRAAGKPKHAGAGNALARWVVALPVLGGATFLSRSPVRLDLGALYAAAFLLAASYSLPPVRLKERGVWGLMAAAIAQRTLPPALVFQAFGLWDAASVAVCVLGTLIGLRHIAVHQILDVHNDERAGVRTLATVHGVAFLERLIRRVVFPLEVVSLVATVLAMAWHLPAVGVLAALYPVWLWQRLRLARGRGTRASPVSYELLADFYFVFLPLLLAALLSLRNPAFLVALAFNVLWQARKLKILVREAVALARA